MCSNYTNSNNTFYVETLGCAKNQVDSEHMITALVNYGMTRVSEPDNAEFIIVNTCGFIQSAKEETIKVLLDSVTRYESSKVIATGCFTQRYAGKMKHMFPGLSGVLGNGDYEVIASVIDEIRAGEFPVRMPDRKFTTLRKTDNLSFPGSAYVKISEGCSNNCRFCAIPLIRGERKSRPSDYILDEISELIRSGVCEINLIAQDLARYGQERSDGYNLVSLLKDICKIEGRYWVRLLYIHPDHFSDELLRTCTEDDRILPYFDIPFQHASRSVLEKMGREGDSEIYLAMLGRIRKALPDAVIRSTFLVGFPGENTTTFNELLAFQKSASINWVGFFPYSREEDTPAYNDGNSLSNWVCLRKNPARIRQLEEAQTILTQEWLNGFKGREMDVLIEENVNTEDLYLGRTFIQAPEVDGLTVVRSDNILEAGKMYRVKILRRNGIDLEAEVVS